MSLHEHPADPGAEPYPSFFRSEVVDWILEVANCQIQRLDQCMYGYRDSGSIWEDVYTQTLTSMGVVQGAASPCCFYHPTWDVAVVVHGDDFTALGTQESLNPCEKAMSSAFEVKLKGRLGHGAEDLK